MRFSTPSGSLSGRELCGLVGRGIFVVGLVQALVWSLALFAAGDVSSALVLLALSPLVGLVQGLIVGLLTVAGLMGWRALTRQRRVRWQEG